jgi:3-methyl-2-oxobutanoate hydroxymethyltransferase
MWQGLHPVLSFDAKWIALPLNDQLGTNLGLLSTETGAMHPITDSGDRRTFIAHHVSWFKDNKFIFAAVGGRGFQCRFDRGTAALIYRFNFGDERGRTRRYKFAYGLQKVVSYIGFCYIEGVGTWAVSRIQGMAPEADMSIIPNGGDGPSAGKGKVTVPDLLQRKSLAAGSTNHKKITCLTAYDYAMGRLVDEAGVDVVLVGDSLGMVMLGYESTLPVTLEEMLHHTKAVRRGVQHALLVADMPYGTYHGEIGDALRNAMRFVKEAGAEAVKVEGGERRLELIAKLTEAEIPVMGHIGLTPQSVNAMGGYRVQGKTPGAAEQLLRDARAVEAAGAFAVVLEGIPRELAAEITRTVRIPTIGIGAGADCDGQVLVLHDLLGLTFQEPPKFARRYANLGEVISQAVREYCEDVQGGTFPTDAESYHAAGTLKGRKIVPVAR